MENKELPTGQEIAIADDFLIQVADHAEKRIDAVIKIKKVALKVTNARDWTDQQGNPYLQSSGSEKVANLFNISWRIDEPVYEEDPDGHYTYSYKGYFSLGGRIIEAEGSRSSKDPFFKQYKYKDDKGNKLTPPLEIAVSDRTNKRDVRMAALTNLLGNGITRILGIRNLTWQDLKEFANITKEQVTTIQYKKGGDPIEMPKSKQNLNIPEKSGESGELISDAQRKRFYAIAKKNGATDDQIKDWLYREYGLEHTKDITKDLYDEICSRVEVELE